LALSGFQLTGASHRVAGVGEKEPGDGRRRVPQKLEVQKPAFIQAKLKLVKPCKHRSNKGPARLRERHHDRIGVPKPGEVPKVSSQASSGRSRNDPKRLDRRSECRILCGTERIHHSAASENISNPACSERRRGNSMVAIRPGDPFFRMS
jgi:hypothetical protein